MLARGEILWQGYLMNANLKSALAQRLADVEARLEAACRRSGRRRGDVTLVAVTKTGPVEWAALLPELGVVELGESRPQELWKKAVALPAARWHLVGHLQRNKIGQTLPLTHMIHSVDSVRLLEALEEEARRQNREVTVLLEVNASHEPQKHGFAPEDIAGVAQRAAGLHFAHIRGLMTMAALDTEPEKCRPTFAELRRLRDNLRERFPLPHRLEHLSMGMSNDFEIAVEEGATLVRLGTVLFQGLGESP
jgi:pyridoxal phosphate enzyme (YggS family)